MIEKEKLDLIPTEDLITLLLDRCEHGCVTLLHEQNDGNVLTRRRWKGNPHTVVGLAFDISRSVLAARDEDSQRIDPGEVDGS